MKTLLLHLLLFQGISRVLAQPLPPEICFSPDGRKLLTGSLPDTGFYDQTEIKTIFLGFSQPDFWEQMDSIYWTWTKKEIPATMTVDGITYDSVGVRFKGQSSFQQIAASLKKSFSIAVDFIHPGQEIGGYKSLNLHNGYGDPSFLREIFYETAIKRHIPAAKSAFVNLYINGENWGLYTNMQQINKVFYRQWYFSAKGSSWRAERRSGAWSPDGDGTGALNYLGEDTSLYQEQYVLKFAEKATPWDDLVKICERLNNSSTAMLVDSLSPLLDIDRTLWFLASEILFSDEDSYIQKGRMDYYIYREKETGRFAPQEYDGNNVMNAGNEEWSPFYHEDSVNYPLLNRLLKEPRLRQRFLAHFRTLLRDYFNPSAADSILDVYKNQIDAIVQNDDKKLFTYQEFLNENVFLKNFIAQRRAFLESNAEVAEEAPVISNVVRSVNNVAWADPEAMQPVKVSAKAAAASGIAAMNLYFSPSLTGPFMQIEMLDDGSNGDSLAGDGIFGADIPGQQGGTWVRFYVEAVSGNASASVAYDPPGAEHDVYVYSTGALTAGSHGKEPLELLLYPNPSQGKFSIKLPEKTEWNGDPLFLAVYNSYGKRILKSTVAQGEMVDMTAIPKGVYVAEWNLKQTVGRQKIVIF